MRVILFIRISEHVFCSYRLTNGAAVRLTGKLVPSPGIGQQKELLIDLSKENTTSSSSLSLVHVLGKCDPEVGCLNLTTTCCRHIYEYYGKVS